MISKLAQLISKSTSDTDSEQHAQGLALAAATLLIEISRADGSIDAAELDALQRILTVDFNISANDVAELIQTARQQSDDAISLQGFTRQLCDAWDATERRRLIEICWEIALVDNVLDAHERHSVRKIAGLLYLNDKEIVLAKQAAQARLNAS